MVDATPTSCPSCGAWMADRYCGACGEKRLAAGDLSLRHFRHELVHGFTHADGKLWKSLRAVTLRPGELSLAYMEGRRRAYMKPVPLFLVLNLLYFLFPLFETFNTSLHSQLNFQPYSGFAQGLAHEAMEHTGTTLDAYADAYGHRSSSNAKLLLILLVFLLAPLLALIYWRRIPWAAGHVTFAFESMVFNLLWTTLALSVVAFGVEKLLHALLPQDGLFFNDGLFSVIALLLNAYFFFAAGRRFYHCSVLGSLWRSVAAFLALFLAMNVYRIVLFLVTHAQVTRALAHH